MIIALSVTSLTPTGPVRIVIDLANALTKVQFFEVHLIILGESSNHEELDTFIDPSIKISRLKVGRRFGVIFGPSSLLRCLKMHNIDTLICAGFRADFFSLFVSRSEANCVSWQLNNPFVDYPLNHGLVGYLLGFLTKLILVRNTINIACSDPIKQDFSELGINSVLIPNFVDTDKFNISQASEKRDAREILGISPDIDSVILFAGVLNLRKNPLEAIGIFREFCVQNPNSLLIICGVGPLEAECRIQSDGLNVRYTGHVDSLQVYYAASDIYLASSLSEGLPLTVLEVLSSGKAVILSDIPSHRSIIRKQEFIGYIYKSGDTLDASRKIEKLLSNTDEHESVLRRNFVLENYSIARAVNTFVSVFPK
jgi:glycosyltransferase involved in cell wall biosynthesis